MINKIGFVQGRLSPKIKNKIQAFPEKNWKKEFKIANKMSLRFMEWTIDYKNLHSNPILTEKGQKEIKKLCSKYKLKILSTVTDCFMEKPFWKLKNIMKPKLKNEFLKILHGTYKVRGKFVILPLVDGGSIENKKQEKALVSFLNKIVPILKKTKMKILLESDYSPTKILKLIKNFNKKYFGINYDIGNSASEGYDPNVELDLYGKYIDNIHVKDRIYKGPTVPLGEGNADFDAVFKKLKKMQYKGKYTLQGAREKNNKHILAIKKYIDFLTKRFQSNINNK